MSQVAVIGSLNYDMFLTLSDVPRIGETANASALKTAAGGKGANQAVQVAKLGIPTYMVGSVGDDWMGQVLKDSLKDAGVKMDYINTCPSEPTGMGIVDVFPDGSVMAVINHGANGAVSVQDVLTAEKVIETSDIVILQLEIPSETVIQSINLAKKHKKKVILNAAPAAELPDEVLEMCDYVIVNEIEASFYTGEAIDSIEKAIETLPKMKQKYGNCWICTLGKNGAVICDSEDPVIIPIVSTEAVETTGAGDSFVGGFAYGLLQGMTQTDAAKFASHCSALTISQVGAQNAMPTRQQITQRYNI